LPVVFKPSKKKVAKCYFYNCLQAEKLIGFCANDFPVKNLKVSNTYCYFILIIVILIIDSNNLHYYRKLRISKKMKIEIKNWYIFLKKVHNKKKTKQHKNENFNWKHTFNVWMLKNYKAYKFQDRNLAIQTYFITLL
jgi:hypothetical protein